MTVHSIIQFRSSNFDKRSKSAINSIIIHSTHISLKKSLNRLCDPDAKVSCHYLIHINGDVYQLVKDSYRAWHAGKSYWQGQESLNDTSIGIELVDTNSRGTRLKGFSSAQMQALIKLLHQLIKRYKIPQRNILAHSDIAPDRKDDPGEYFDWKGLACLGIGIYHDVKINQQTRKCFIDSKSPISSIKNLQRLFKNYGYKIKPTGQFDNQTVEIMTAFRQHFNPKLLKKSCCSVADYEILTSLTRKL